MMKVVISLLSCVFLLSACGAGKNKTNVELIQDMMDQKNLKSQDFDELRNQPGMLIPPADTVPRGYTPYKYAGNPLEAEKSLVNPLAGKVNDTQILARGKDRYDIYCGICHGVQGKGDGKIAEYFALKPPPLVSDKVKAFKDGRIFHIITDGQGIMQTYATQVTKDEDRWAIVNYIRTLQKE